MSIYTSPNTHTGVLFCETADSFSSASSLASLVSSPSRTPPAAACFELPELASARVRTKNESVAGVLCFVPRSVRHEGGHEIGVRHCARTIAVPLVDASAESFATAEFSASASAPASASSVFSVPSFGSTKHFGVFTTQNFSQYVCDFSAAKCVSPRKANASFEAQPAVYVSLDTSKTSAAFTEASRARVANTRLDSEAVLSPSGSEARVFSDARHFSSASTNSTIFGPNASPVPRLSVSSARLVTSVRSPSISVSVDESRKHCFNLSTKKRRSCAVSRPSLRTVTSRVPSASGIESFVIAFSTINAEHSSKAAHRMTRKSCPAAALCANLPATRSDFVASAMTETWLFWG
mmetsp:Transcript_11469/g.42472  ORF Transcript_11469/g.42472 Transcript_11469/m.42472 type:complete len:351 (-) Transcript_11469:3684-4736(-)